MVANREGIPMEPIGDRTELELERYAKYINGLEEWIGEVFDVAYTIDVMGKEDAEAGEFDSWRRDLCDKIIASCPIFGGRRIVQNSHRFDAHGAIIDELNERYGTPLDEALERGRGNVSSPASVHIKAAMDYMDDIINGKVGG